MHTSLILLAALSPAAAPPEAASTWQEDYRAARLQSKQENKPLAIFFGAGQEGWQNVSAGRPLSAEARRLLARQYVALFIDLQTGYGADLARDFGVKGPGLVLSTPGGIYEAFSHEGPLAVADLERTLRTHGTPAPAPAPAQPVTRTAGYFSPALAPTAGSNPQVVTAAYQPAAAAPAGVVPSFTPAAQPSFSPTPSYAAPSFAPSYGASSYAAPSFAPSPAYAPSYAAPARSFAPAPSFGGGSRPAANC